MALSEIVSNGLKLSPLVRGLRPIEVTAIIKNNKFEIIPVGKGIKTQENSHHFQTTEV